MKHIAEDLISLARDMDSLIEDSSNARKHSDKNIETIKNSLRRFGQRKPIVVQKKDDSLIIRAGNGTFTAAKALGWKKIAAVIIEENSMDATAYAIADNRSGELAEWDQEILAKQLKELDEMDFSLDEIGFDSSDLEDIIDDEKKGNIDDDDVPEVKPEESFVKRGEIWSLGRHRLMCGDSTSIKDVERLMSGEKADMVFTDPPYGVSYEKKTKEIFNQKNQYRKIENDDISIDDLTVVIKKAFENINNILKEKSSYYICSPQGGDLGFMMLDMMRESNIPCRHQIIWCKNAPVFSMGRLDYDYKHEPILYGWSENRTHNFYGHGEMKSSVWQVDREPNKLHPTMKPLALPENAILNSTEKNHNVYDPFSGSGSTLIASEKIGRKCFAMEIDPHYCSVIIKRWEEYSGNKANKLS